MLKHSLAFLTALALTAFLLPACDTLGGGLFDPVEELVAERFVGSGPINVSGPDADNDEAVDVASDMLTGRRFDLTPDGFTISSGDVSSEAPAGSDFGVEDGTLDVDGDTATMQFDMFST